MKRRPQTGPPKERLFPLGVASAEIAQCAEMLRYRLKAPRPQLRPHIGGTDEPALLLEFRACALDVFQRDPRTSAPFSCLLHVVLRVRRNFSGAAYSHLTHCRNFVMETACALAAVRRAFVPGELSTGVDNLKIGVVLRAVAERRLVDGVLTTVPEDKSDCRSAWHRVGHVRLDLLKIMRQNSHPPGSPGSRPLMHSALDAPTLEIVLPVSPDVHAALREHQVAVADTAHAFKEQATTTAMLLQAAFLTPSPRAAAAERRASHLAPFAQWRPFC